MKLQHNIKPGPRPYLKDRHEKLSQLQWKRIAAKRLSPCIGAEISGVDLRKPLDSETFDEIYAALLAYRVIFFRDQDISSKQHMVAAYECLDEETKILIEGKHAVNDFTQVFGLLLSPEELAEQQKKFPAVEHPLVRTSPETGERSLYANAPFTSHIAGMDRDESDQLLGRLFLEAGVPEYQCRFRWQKDSIAFWDNRVVQHYAANDYWPQRRQMDRVTIIGDRPI